MDWKPWTWEEKKGRLGILHGCCIRNKQKCAGWSYAWYRIGLFLVLAVFTWMDSWYCRYL